MVDSFFIGPFDFIYVKKVLGQDGKPFNMYKIRTMYKGSESKFGEIGDLLGQDPLGKFPNDPRIIPIVGQILRAYWLDETPQIFNIIRGDMDLVGVRPRTDDEWNKVMREYNINEDHRRMVLQFRPGWMGVNYSEKIRDYKDALEIEREYCKKKKENPEKTDRIYRDKILRNIILGGLRSS